MIIETTYSYNKHETKFICSPTPIMPLANMPHLIAKGMTEPGAKLALETSHRDALAPSGTCSPLADKQRCVSDCCVLRPKPLTEQWGKKVILAQFGWDLVRHDREAQRWQNPSVWQQDCEVVASPLWQSRVQEPGAVLASKGPPLLRDSKVFKLVPQAPWPGIKLWASRFKCSQGDRQGSSHSIYSCVHSLKHMTITKLRLWTVRSLVQSHPAPSKCTVRPHNPILHHGFPFVCST